ncbi:alpha/beta hydrolase, partial [Streptomyces rubrogriseus]|nr:alpha/beta hydrolase [Streptomyces rubrogriseus]
MQQNPHTHAAPGAARPVLRGVRRRLAGVTAAVA